eukprot:1505593-Pyramimonas_sp.AAC.1
MPAMPTDLKALRAKHRKEDAEFFNGKLTTLIKHEQHCQNMSKLTDRQAAIARLTCCKRLQAIRVERRACDRMV